MKPGCETAQFPRRKKQITATSVSLTERASTATSVPTVVYGSSVASSEPQAVVVVGSPEMLSEREREMKQRRLIEIRERGGAL